MSYWKTPEDLGLTAEQINQICEELWQKNSAKKSCPDCSVNPGEKHWNACDVPNCNSCGIQKIQCECGDTSPRMWDGIYPGIRECYEQKLICFNSGSEEWMFDLNTWYINNMK